MKIGFSFAAPAFLLIMIIVPCLSFGQESGSCAEKLKEAQALFDRGQVEKVPQILQDCMRSGFKREEQLSAYRLLIQSFLLEDKLGEADSVMLAFLKKYPEYQMSPTDHPSFSYLFNNFRIRQIVQVSFKIGTNIPFLTNVNVRTLSSESEESDYSGEAFNLYTGAEVKIPITQKLGLNVEGAFLQSQFKNTETFLDHAVINYTEKLSRLELPVSVTLDLYTPGRLTTFIRAGAGIAINLASSAKATLDPSDINNYLVVSGADLGRNESRIFSDIIIVAGAGIRFKTPGGFLNLEARTGLGMLNQVVRSGSEAEVVLRDDYRFIDDDFNMNNLIISIGYTQIFYKPSKRK